MRRAGKVVSRTTSHSRGSLLPLGSPDFIDRFKDSSTDKDANGGEARAGWD